jgi:hypothetical protein
VFQPPFCNINLHFLQGIESDTIMIDGWMCGIVETKVREIVFFHKIFGNCMLATTQWSSDPYEHVTVELTLFDAVRSVKVIVLKKSRSFDAKRITRDSLEKLQQKMILKLGLLNDCSQSLVVSQEFSYFTNSYFFY